MNSSARRQNTACSRDSCRSCPLTRKLLIAAPSSATTTPTPPSATVSAALSAPATAVASSASGVLGLGARLVHVERASAHLRAIQRSNGLVSIFIAGHFHEAESA